MLQIPLQSGIANARFAQGPPGDKFADSNRRAALPGTAFNHVANLLAKLGLHSQLQALVFALRYGVVEIQQLAGGVARHQRGW